MDPHSKDENDDQSLQLWWVNPPVYMGTSLWTNCKYKDFQIVIGDRVIDVHKCVLAARSPVFTAMLASGLTETKSGQLIIQDFDFDTVEMAIKFFYTQRLVKFINIESSSVICELLKFGHKYDSQTLIEACLSQIKLRRLSYQICERKILMKLAFDLGSDQIIDLIMNIFGSFNQDLYPYSSYSYPAIGDVLDKDDSFKDLKIICDGGQEFSIHKCILALRSPVFGQMIDKMAENGDTSSQLTIDRIKPVVLEYAVQFFYTGCIKIDEETLKKNPAADLILGLLEFAERFKVEQLVSSCLQKMYQDNQSVDQEAILIYIQNAFNFKSKKILHYILGIFRTQRFPYFNITKASKESYWN